MKYCLQSMYNHMVGRTASVISPLYSLLPVTALLKVPSAHPFKDLHVLFLSANFLPCRYLQLTFSVISIENEGSL